MRGLTDPVASTMAANRTLQARLRAFFEDSRWGGSVREVTPAMLKDARVRFGGDSTLRAVQERLASHSCCVNVLVVGGSTTCGKGKPNERGFPTAPGVVAAGGVDGAWPSLLRAALDNVTRHCCARGHTLHNLCRDSAGIDYALTTFETRLAAAHASQRAHLLLVDTAPNDFNTYWLASKRLVRRIGDKVHNSTQLQTEAFVRRVLSLSDAPALAFVETAWFEPVADRPSGEVFGAWDDHRAVLEHYRVPAVHMPLALVGHNDHLGPRRGLAPRPHRVAPPDAGADLAARAEARRDLRPLSRAQLIIDHLHLSAAGHWTLAFFVASALLAPSERRSAAKPTVAPPVLPRPRAPLADLEPLTRSPLTSLDFTQPSEAEAAVSNLSTCSGWAWRLSTKGTDGRYILSEPRAADRAALRHGKLGLVAAASGSGTEAPTFSVRVRARTAFVRVGYLRSYSGRVNVLVQAVGAPWSSVLNGTWELPVSIFSTSVFDLSSALCAGHADCGSGPLGLDLELRFTVIPGTEPSDFTVYSIETW